MIWELETNLMSFLTHFWLWLQVLWANWIAKGFGLLCQCSGSQVPQPTWSCHEWHSWQLGNLTSALGAFLSPTLIWCNILRDSGEIFVGAKFHEILVKLFQFQEKPFALRPLISVRKSPPHSWKLERNLVTGTMGQIFLVKISFFGGNIWDYRKATGVPC